MCFSQWLFEYQGLGVIATFLVILVALIPILKEWVHKCKYKKILREEILIEIRDINESCSGKKEHYKNEWNKKILKLKYQNMLKIFLNDFQYHLKSAHI